MNHNDGYIPLKGTYKSLMMYISLLLVLYVSEETQGIR